jgi:hypothetical protein
MSWKCPSLRQVSDFNEVEKARVETYPQND